MLQGAHQNVSGVGVIALVGTFARQAGLNIAPLGAEQFHSHMHKEQTANHNAKTETVAERNPDLFAQGVVHGFVNDLKGSTVSPGK